MNSKFEKYTINVMHDGPGDFRNVDPKVYSYILRGCLDLSGSDQAVIRNERRITMSGIGKHGDFLKLPCAPTIRFVQFYVESINPRITFTVTQDFALPLNSVHRGRLILRKKDDQISIKDGEVVVDQGQTWPELKAWLKSL